MESIWQAVQLPAFQELGGDMHTDVLIIGGGIAGIFTAYFLHQVRTAIGGKIRVLTEQGTSTITGAISPI